MDARLLQTERPTRRPMASGDVADDAAMMAAPRAGFLAGPRGPEAGWNPVRHGVACRARFRRGAPVVGRRDGGQTAGQVGRNAGPRSLHPARAGRAPATGAARGLRHRRPA